MNKFATIEKAIVFNKVTYYTIRLEEEEYTEFEKFVIKNRSNHLIHNEYNDLMAFLDRMGKRTGALKRYFTRNEDKAEALPPEWDSLFARERKLHVKYQHNLRLYCMRISNEIVFLFNGDVKTPGHISAQQCSVVRKYFLMANSLSAAIDVAMKEKEICLNGIKLDIEEELELMIKL